MASVAERLDAAVKAVCPIAGIAIGRMGEPATVRVDFAAQATRAEKTAALAVVESFDWSDAAHTDYERRFRLADLSAEARDRLLWMMMQDFLEHRPEVAKELGL